MKPKINLKMTISNDKKTITIRPNFLCLTEKEASYLTVLLIKYRDIQRTMEIKQDKEYASVRNKLTNLNRIFEGKDPI